MPDPVPVAPAPPSVVDASVANWLPGDANDAAAAQIQSRREAHTTGDEGGAWSAPALAQALVKQFPDKVEAYHAGSDQFIKADPALIEHGFKQGQVTFRADQTLHVQRPDGTIVPVAGAAISDELNKGGHLASPRAARDQELIAKTQQGGTGLAAVAGLGRGFSAGMTDLGLTAPEAEEAEALKTGHPLVSGLGEAGGMLGQAALTGGGLASIAEEGAGAVAGKGLAGRLTVQGARGAVEMAQLAHTDMVSEEAIGGAPLTAEKYWSTIGKEALGGAVLGAGGALVAEGLGAGKRAIVGALTKRASAADLDGVAAKAAGGYKPGGVGEALVKLQAVLSGADAEGTEAIRNAGVQNQSAEAKALRATAVDIEGVRSDAVKSLSGDMDNLLKKTEAIADESRGISKREHLKGLVESPLPAPEVQAHAMDSLQEVRNQVAEMAQDGDRYGNGGALKRIDQQLRAHEKDLVAAVEKGDHAEMFAVLDDTKRTIGGWSRKFSAAARAGDPLAREQAQEVFTKLGDVERGGGIYEALRSNLEDESTWGQAAVSQKGINAAWTDYIAASKQLGRAASVTTQVGENNFGRAVYAVDPAKMERYVAGLVNPNNDLAHKAMADYIGASKRLAGAIDDGFQLSPEKQAMVTAVKASSLQMERGLADIGQKLAKVNQIKALIDAGRGSFGALYGHMIGGAVGGAIGAAVSPDDRAAGAAAGGMLGMGVSALSNPGKNIMRLAQLEGVVRTFDEKMGGAIKRFFAKGEQVAAVGAKDAAEPGVGARVKKAAQTVNRGRQEADRDATRREYERRVAALAPMTNLDTLNARMGPHYERLEGSAPKTASALGQTAATVVGYALSKMPKTAPADMLSGKPGLPSYSEMARFNREMETMEDPAVFADDFEKGRITTDQVDAFRNAFPASFEELQGKVQQSLLEHAQAGHPVSFQQRITLGMLLDIETDPSLTKDSMSHATATYATAPTPPDKPPGNGGRSGADASSKGHAMTTPAQQMSAGTAL